MTSKERMLVAMRRGQPDRVPVAPDFSNMIPCRLTGRPFWDVYLYQNPPIWRAYIDAAKYFGTDGWNVNVWHIEYDWMRQERETAEREDEWRWRRVIVGQTEDRIYVRHLGEHKAIRGRRTWPPTVDVFYRADSPTGAVPVEKLGLPAEPADWEEITGIKEWPTGPELYELARREMGDAGVTSLFCPVVALGSNLTDACEYADNPAAFRKRIEKAAEYWLRTLKSHLALKPDFILTGASGLLTFNSPAIFRDLGLWQLQQITRLCRKAGVPSQVHCCGREYALVKAAAEETDLDSINPLEPPPMGDCELAQIKRQFGDRLSLMGNLHTTEVMLRGNPKQVAEAARNAIEAAAAGGGFILSTGDQCGRDTPDANIHAMIGAAELHGRY